MIYISNSFVLHADLMEVINRLRIVLTNGKLKEVQDKSTDILVTCPIHDGGHEDTASCFIRKKDGVFHCFGCGAKGSFLRFVAACFNSSEEYAKEWLLQNFKGEIVEKAFAMDEPIQIGKNRIKKPTLDESILDQYQKWTPYLAKRKLSREICEQFKVRYDPKYRQVIFPAYDIHGNLVMMPKRSIDTKTFYLDKDVEKPVYCLDYIMKNNIKRAIITEGPFDCLTGWEYGYPTVATLGKISDYQIAQLNKSCLNVLYAMFDNDEAGRRFNAMLKAKLAKRIIIVDVKIPDGKKDINDLSKEEFEKALQEASNS